MNVIPTLKELDSLAEFELLVRCSRSELREEDTARIEEILHGETLDWGRVFALASYHGVQPLLYCHLRQVDPSRVSEDRMTWLRGVVGARTAHSLVLVQELGRLATLFEKEGVAVIVMKGPVLALSVYGSIATRPFVDLDLIIRRQDFERVEALLQTEGYQDREMTPLQKATYLFIHGQYTFWRRIASMGSAHSVLDVHTAIMPPGYSYTETFDALLERSHTLSVGGGAPRTLEPEDLLVVLCYHGFKNRWDRLKYICDVAEVLRAYPDLKWDTIRDRIGATRSRRVLWLGLYLASEVLAAPLPPAIEWAMREDTNVTQLGNDIIGRLPMQAQMRVEPYLDRVRLNILGQDTLRGRLRYGAYAAARRASEFYLPESG